MFNSPKSKIDTNRIGIAQKTSKRYPNTTFPMMAPIRAASIVTAKAVDLEITIKGTKLKKMKLERALYPDKVTLRQHRQKSYAGKQQCTCH